MNEEERKMEEEEMATRKGEEVPQRIPASGSGSRQDQKLKMCVLLLG